MIGFDDCSIGDVVFYIGEKWVVYHKDDDDDFSFLQNVFLENSTHWVGARHEDLKPVLKVYAQLGGLK